MSSFKDFYNPRSIRSMANSIQKAFPAFDTQAFLKVALPPLKNKEMKDRVRWISKSLQEFLPQDFQKSSKILVASLQSEKNPSGINGFLAWPLTQFIEDFGLENFQDSMNSLKEMTKVMSAEFAIRPFLIKYEKESISLLNEWAKDQNVHVRRLVSEGTRPRLPWGQRLFHFQKNPKICLGLLRQLRLDPEIYVRKSVANHLNDISKDHPEFLIHELSKWVKEYPNDPKIKWIVKHALRSLIKQGNADTLSLLGFKKAKIRAPRLEISPAKLKFGNSIKITFSALSEVAEKWLIDYVIYHKKANGELKPKVFKWTTKTLSKNEKISLSKNHAFRKISTRQYYAGKHLVEIQVNGARVSRKEFILEI